MLSRLEEICRDQCKKWDINLMEFSGESDHIHLLIDLHPSITPSKFINSLKTVSSRLIRKEFSNYLKSYYSKPVLWTRAYCLLTVGGAPLEILKEYIRKQDRPG